MAKGMNIKEKIASSLLDAFLNPLLAWFTEQAADNIPITMDAAKAKALELFHSFSNDTPEQQEIIVNYAGAFMDGVKCGEQRKETAMIEGMKKCRLVRNANTVCSVASTRDAGKNGNRRPCYTTTSCACYQNYC